MTSKRQAPRDPFGAIKRLSPAASRARVSAEAIRQQVRRGGTPESRTFSWPEVDVDRNPAAAALHEATSNEKEG